jgi:cell division transport system ATP-binding protein
VMQLLTAALKPTSGSIMVDGKRIDKLPEKSIPVLRRQIGTIFQDFKLLPDRTIGENVAFALEVSGAGNREISRSVPMVLDVVKLKNKIDRYPNEISGGEKQRVSIARALVHRPKIILADEPTGNLDLINTWEIIQLLVKINELGTTIILTTHNKDVVNNLKRRVITLDKGHLVRDQENGRYII